MANFLSALALLFALAGLNAYQWITAFPRLGVGILNRIPTIRRLLGTASLLSMGLALRLRPSGRRSLLAGLNLLVLSFWRFFQARRILVALDRAEHVAAPLADLDPQAELLALEWNGTAYAWPLETLIVRHIYNDTLGAEPVLVAWCHACRSGAVYRRDVAGRPLTFEVLAVWRGNMVMRDRETGSIWQQATGEAVDGLLRGHRLPLLGGARVRYAAWQAAYPGGWISLEPAGAPRGIVPGKFILPVIHFATEAATPPGLNPRDRRLASKTEVGGIALNGACRAYPLAQLAERGLVNDTLAGIPLAVYFDPAANRVAAFRRDPDGTALTLSLQDGVLATPAGDQVWNEAGRPLQGATRPLMPLRVDRQWWAGWSEFHPGCSVYRHTA